MLSGLGVDYEVTLLPDIAENYPKSLKGDEIPMYIAREKAEAYRDMMNAGDLIITADTIVYLDGEVLGKPRDEADACNMLRKLSGRTHRVITGVCLTTQQFQRVFSVDVGDGSQGRPLDGDRDTRERFTMTVGDSSGEGPCSLLHRSCIHMTRWERASSCGQRRAATCTGQEGACEKFPVCHKCESIKVQFFRSIDKVKDEAYPYAVTVFANICISFKTIVRFCPYY